jgi:hypothetical protein
MEASHFVLPMEWRVLSAALPELMLDDIANETGVFSETTKDDFAAPTRGCRPALSLLEQFPIGRHPLTQLRVRLGFASPTLLNPLPSRGETKGEGALVPMRSD